MRGTYVYAILAGEPHLELGPIGLPGGATPVTSRSMAGLTAVVSDYSGPAFEKLTKSALLTSLGLHQRVLEQILAHHALLPVQFGTIVPSIDAALGLLRRYSNRLVDELRAVGDSVEIDLSASWDVNTMLANIAQEPAVAALAGATRSSAEDGLAAQVRVGMLVQETLERMRDEYRRRIVEKLVGLARDAEPHPLPTEELVANLAFLVERVELERFEAAVDRLGEELGDRLSFRYVGPLPPHSFATVQLTRPDPAEIEEARRVLGLGESVSGAELQQAYRELAAEAHPDRNSGDTEAESRFSSLGAARDALRGYVQGQRANEREDINQRIDIGPTTVAETILLNIRRTDANPSSSFGSGS